MTRPRPASLDSIGESLVLLQSLIDQKLLHYIIETILVEARSHLGANRPVHSTGGKFGFRWKRAASYNRAMLNLHTPEGALFLIQILTSAMLAILFLQSGIDKVIDRKGNIDWLTGHFAKSPLAPLVSLMVTSITILELAAGTLSAVGCVLILLRRDSACAFYGAVISAVAIVALFFGQRMAKDYPGAATLVPYFLLCAVAIYALA
jgi:hypothetical protein